MHLLLGVRAFGDVPKDEHDPGDFPLLIADGGGAVVDGSFRAVFGKEQRVVRQPDDHAISQGSDGRTLNRLAALFVDDAEHVVEWMPHRLF